jgi:hypothetical protein
MKNSISWYTDHCLWASLKRRLSLRLYVFIGAVFIASSGSLSAQNLLMISGEVDFFDPFAWNSAIGFNVGVDILDAYFQNDSFLVFGALTISGKGLDTAKPHFIGGVRDNFFYSFESEWIGLRLGASVMAGIYTGAWFNFCVNVAPLLGMVICPQSAVSYVIDVTPGYKWAVNLSKKNKSFAAVRSEGFSMPVTVSVRLNLDKLE